MPKGDSRSAPAGISSALLSPDRALRKNNTNMTIAERVRENLKLAQDTATPYVESAQRSAGVAFASVQEKLGRGHGGMHHSASSKDVTVRCFTEPSSGQSACICCEFSALYCIWMAVYRSRVSPPPIHLIALGRLQEVTAHSSREMRVLADK